MHAPLYRYFSLLLAITFFTHAGGNIEQASQEEEIKDTIVVHGMVLHGKVMNLGPEKLSQKQLFEQKH